MLYITLLIMHTRLGKHSIWFILKRTVLSVHIYFHMTVEWIETNLKYKI